MKRSEGREPCPGGRSRLALNECKTFNRFGARRGVFSWNLVMQSYPGNLCDLANSYLEFKSQRILESKDVVQSTKEIVVVFPFQVYFGRSFYWTCKDHGTVNLNAGHLRCGRV